MLLWWTIGSIGSFKAHHEYFIAHFGVFFWGKNCCSFDQFFWKLLYCIVNLKNFVNFSGYFCKLSEHHKIQEEKKKKKKTLFKYFYLFFQILFFLN